MHYIRLPSSLRLKKSSCKIGKKLRLKSVRHLHGKQASIKAVKFYLPFSAPDSSQGKYQLSRAPLWARTYSQIHAPSFSGKIKFETSILYDF